LQVQAVDSGPAEIGSPEIAAGATNTPSPARPTRLPKRPKGRLFVGALFMGVAGLIVYQVWEGSFRNQAYGTLVGRTIEVSAPWDGAVRCVHVREGDQVRQGQPLVTLDNFLLRQKLEEVGDELRIAQATLAAQISQLQWQAQSHADMQQKAVADHMDAWGRLLHEQATLTDLELRLERVGKLELAKVITEEERDHTKLAVEGQRQKVAKLDVALTELRKRAESAMRREDDGTVQLRPHILRIEVLQAELARLRDQLAQCTVRSPVDGIVVRRECSGGEHVTAFKSMLEVLEQGSLEVVLYLNQDDSKLLAVDDELAVRVEPYDEPVDCRVTRLGTQFEPAPPSIKRHYRSEQKLLPIYLSPLEPDGGHVALRVGGVVTLARRWTRSGEAPTTAEREEPAAPRDLAAPGQVVRASAIMPIVDNTDIRAVGRGANVAGPVQANGYLARRPRPQAD
jgi:multidrug resistance efflux pump